MEYYTIDERLSDEAVIVFDIAVLMALARSFKKTATLAFAETTGLSVSSGPFEIGAGLSEVSARLFESNLLMKKAAGLSESSGASVASVGSSEAENIITVFSVSATGVSVDDISEPEPSVVGADGDSVSPVKGSVASETTAFSDIILGGSEVSAVFPVTSTEFLEKVFEVSESSVGLSDPGAGISEVVTGISTISVSDGFMGASL